jgi:hypothetical protein
LKEKGIKMIMIGYANKQPLDMHKMMNPEAVAVWSARYTKWLQWVRPDPK